MALLVTHPESEGFAIRMLTLNLETLNFTEQPITGLRDHANLFKCFKLDSHRYGIVGTDADAADEKDQGILIVDTAAQTTTHLPRGGADTYPEFPLSNGQYLGFGYHSKWTRNLNFIYWLSFAE